jgi:hypothetical protein
MLAEPASLEKRGIATGSADASERAKAWRAEANVRRRGVGSPGPWVARIILGPRHVPFPPAARDRQRSLQYRTCSQHRSHFFRHAKGFPQAAQFFVGKVTRLRWRPMRQAPLCDRGAWAV